MTWDEWVKRRKSLESSQFDRLMDILESIDGKLEILPKQLTEDHEVIRDYFEEARAKDIEKNTKRGRTDRNGV